MKGSAMHTPISLDVIDIPRPCPADWAAMHGNDRVRFCDQCQLHVYNLSALTRDAAEALVTEKEGHLCVRMYRRQDGTVITADCGGGWKLRAKRLGRLTALACAAVLSGIVAPWMAGSGGRTGAFQSAGSTDASWPVKVLGKVIDSLQGPQAERGEMAVNEIKGDVALPVQGGLRPPPPPATQPTTQLVPLMGESTVCLPTTQPTP